MFQKVLIANRGEIALRILRALKEMNIRSVAVHSMADVDAMHVRLADESVCIGPALSRESYLNATSILAAAELTNADAIHPGVGFLSENADFARMVEDHGITFIGPSPAHMMMMGHKVKAKQAAHDMGLPLVPGSEGHVTSPSEASSCVKKLGYPFLMKAVHGGGGKGMRVVRQGDDVAKTLSLTRAEALANFGSDEVYLERYLETPRHIELQVLADQAGNVLILGERDCSVQRRHQKIWEEAPAPGIDRALVEALSEKAAAAMKRMGYVGAGTLEFLFEDGEFYFIEMNTRIQVEHPVTEMITGIDLIKEQIKVAYGDSLSLKQEDVVVKGHAVECRINAEDPETFLPAPGLIEAYLPPGGPHVRVDSGLYQGYKVPPYYDSLIAKLIVYGDTRAECLQRLKRALGEYVISGPSTLIPLHRRLVEDPVIHEGAYHIHWLEHWMERCAQAA
ncbi:acetyl-CoA carboxylase biotin carboxylase subunit [Candidatus Hepatobacter penaei]|uniref:acetyl-CoA carboxylase biotin carboxylase subunit n=1 Tax=Candidatus Hepatobacter penaei TaxID=1274402 RepID=UPI0004F23F06|nr:acetyl-CoA carboxylase biotin carboxylase subunit [Candidatus Hepatobacter penaei]TGW15555.1 acetyl-CoA carboxylase biotin carboxylase subunit [bacterium NHP-B]